MDAKLVVVGDNAKPSEIKLNLPVTIGRGRQSNLILPLPVISRRHCEIFEANGYLVVRDLNSMNGTYINNRCISEAILAPGELLTVGTITFRAVYEVDQLPAQAEREPQQATPSPAVASSQDGGSDQDGGSGQDGGSDSEDRCKTLDAAELKPDDGEEVATEVSDVDPEEFLEQLREAQRRAGDS